MRISDWSSDVCSSDLNHREERSATQWAGRGQAVDNPGMIPGPESCPQAVPERASSYQRDVNAIKFNKFNKLTVLQPAFRNTITTSFCIYQILEARSEEHTSELQSLMRTEYAVFCLKTTITNSHR